MNVFEGMKAKLKEINIVIKKWKLLPMNWDHYSYIILLYIHMKQMYGSFKENAL